MFLVAQVLSTVPSEHFCVKLPEHEEVAAPLASLARTSASTDLRVPSVPQPHGTTARISVVKFAPET